MACQVPYNFTPRDYQLDFLSEMQRGEKRYAIIMWARRHGKDKTCFCFLINQMIQNKGNYGYVFPTSTLARNAAWDNIDKDGFRLLDHIPAKLVKRKTQNRMFIELVNGSTLTFFGSDKQLSVGTNYKGLIFSEFSLQDPQAYFYLRPVITENKGFIILNGTPRGKNHFFDLWNLAKANPDDWYTQKVTWKDSKVFTEKDMQRERDAGMSDEMINSEYNCDFAGLEGSYYIHYVDKMRIENRIGYVPHEPNEKVSTAWDLGINDMMTIVFFQRVGQEIRVIDTYANNSEGLEHYAQIVNAKPYLYDTHYAPHDIEVRELGTGISRKEIAYNLGIDFYVLPTLRIRVLDGIETVRGMFNRFWIDEKKCKELLVSLENYSCEFDNKAKVFVNYPKHNRFSHFADAFKYMCIACHVNTSSNSGFSIEDLYSKNRRGRML